MSSKTKTTATKEEEKPALVPKLRFPVFQERWREMTFGELLDDIIDFRGRTPVKLGMEWGNGNITSLSANNVKNGFIDYKAECNLGSEELYQRWMGDVSLEKNDIVFTMEAPLGNALLLPDSRKYILSQRVVAFKTNSQVVNPFLVQLIWSKGFQDAISELSTGSTAKGINQKALKTVPLMIPHPKEQQKIAECLSSVDELMAAQARKVDALKTHKKGLMQQLFPREGETQPRLRFPEFQNAGEWEVKRLGEVAEVASGQVDPKRQPYRDYPQIGSENIEANTGKVVNVRTAREKGVISGNYLFDEKDVLYSKIRPALNKVAAPEFKGICSADIYPIRPANEDLHRIYLVFLLLSERFLEYAIRNSERGKIPKINRDALLTYEALIPSPAEQHRIATCLTSLDALIAAETQKHAALQRHKRGLMQQLFPSPEE